MATSTILTRLAALTALKGVGQALNAASLILYSNGVAITPATVMADLTECTFTGYAADAGQAFGTSYLDPAGVPSIAAPSVQFESTDGVVVETIYGWALTNVGKTALYYAEALPVPVPITAGSQGVIIQPTVRYGD